MKRREDRLRSFRRGQSVARRRRTLLLRLLKPFVAALVLVGAPVALGSWLLYSPRFALRRVSLELGPRVERAWVEEALRSFRSRNLVLLSLAEVEAALESHPWIRGVELRKELPDRLWVVVVEREPVAVLVREDGLHYLEADGYVIPSSIAADEAPAGLLRVLAGRTPEAIPAALEAARQLAGAAPDWYERLSRVEILSREEFRLETTALEFPVLVRAGAVGQKVKSLRALLPGIEERLGELAAVDLRFFRWIVLKPRVAPAEPATRPLSREG